MVHGLGVVSLVDGDGGVNNLGSNDLLLDDGLDVLVDVVMDALTLDSGCCGGGVFGVVDDAGVTELGTLSLESIPSLGLVSVIKCLVLNSSDVVGVLLGS